MMRLVASLLLLSGAAFAQPGPTTTVVGNKRAQDVNCVSGCSAGGGGGDGGYATTWLAGMVDGGSLPVSVSGTVNVNIVDGGSPLPVRAQQEGSWTVAGTGTFTVGDGAGPLTVDGTVTANQGGAPWSVSQSGSPWGVAINQTTTNNDVDVLTLPTVTIGTFPDNEPINVAQMNGTAVTMGNGVSGTGVQRVTIASDSTGQVAVASLPSVTIGTFPDNEPFNLNQLAGSAVSAGVGASGTGTLRTASLIHDGTDTALVTTGGSLQTDTTSIAGTATATGNGVVGAGVQRVAIASDNTAFSVNAVQSGTWTVQPGNTPNTSPWLTTDTPRQVGSANNTGTCTSVTTSSTTVLASNASRRAYGFKAHNNNTALVHCKLGATATTSNTSFNKADAWSQDTGAVYTGVIDCIAASGTQTVCVYEMN